MHTLNDIFAVFERQFPPALIGKAQIERLRGITAHLTDAIAGGYVLECRLSSADPQVDLGLCVDPAVDQGREWLAFELPDTLRQHQVWQNISRLCQTWSDSTSPLHDHVSTLWLEFDLDDHASLLPSLFLGLTPQAKPHAAQIIAIAQQHLAIQPDAVQQQQLDRALDHLPADAEPFQIGWMLARGESSLRLCVRGKPGSDLYDYLPAIGWSGSADDLRSLLTEAGQFVDVLALDFDVTPSGIGARIGIECRYDNWKQPGQEPRWQHFLDWLVQRQICLPEKRAALPTWTSVGYHIFAGERLPTALVRLINHVKIVYTPAQPPQAKGYLLFGHRSAALLKALKK
ncbi:MAG: hypothetical protein KF726_26635 [Anaerolineae bacterium]|nr:hypothetical protein [Anaerolineae bacterium]